MKLNIDGAIVRLSLKAHLTRKFMIPIISWTTIFGRTWIVICRSRTKDIIELVIHSLLSCCKPTSENQLLAIYCKWVIDYLANPSMPQYHISKPYHLEFNETSKLFRICVFDRAQLHCISHNVDNTIQNPMPFCPTNNALVKKPLSDENQGDQYCRNIQTTTP